MSARYDPHFHIKLGTTLRPMRCNDTLIIGSGGSVHNLYRNHWEHMFRFNDNFAQPVPPDPWALQFRQAVEDAYIYMYSNAKHPALPFRVGLRGYRSELLL